MPSPCEVMPTALANTADETTASLMRDLHGTGGVIGVRRGRGTVHRVVPAMAGGLFAGLLLVGLGCTPLFQPAGAKAAGDGRQQQATIVLAASDDVAPARSAKPQGGGEKVAATPQASGPAVVAAPGSDAPEGAGSGHRFMIVCEGEGHDGAEDASAPRPESVALQGIMAGSSSRAALLNGVLYREGDRFGSQRCPWTIASIEPASVRIEKTFGDRVCGVTIRFVNEKAAQPMTTTTPRAGSVTSQRSAASRSR